MNLPSEGLVMFHLLSRQEKVQTPYHEPIYELYDKMNDKIKFGRIIAHGTLHADPAGTKVNEALAD